MKVEVVAAVFMLLLLVFIGCALVAMMNSYTNAPCESFRNTSVKNIPARCVGYYGLTEGRSNVG